MDVFIHIRGFLRVPIGEATFKSHKFSVRHDDSEKIAEFINDAMMEIVNMKGMITPKDENKSTKGIEGFNNIKFWHIDNFAHFEIETKILTAQIPDPKRVELLQ